MSRFNAVEKSQSSVLKKVAMAEEQKTSAEQRSKLVCSRAGNLEENFSQLSEERREVELTMADIEERLEALLTEFDSLKISKENIISRDNTLKASHDEALAEWEAFTEELERLSDRDAEIEKAFQMLQRAFDLMRDEKEGVLDVNEETNASYSELEIQHKNLMEEKQNIIKQDQDLAKTFKDLTEQLSKLENQRRGYQAKVEEIDWETCMLQNQM